MHSAEKNHVAGKIIMYLQGNLQQVFDALYKMGVIGLVLESDWVKEIENFSGHYINYVDAIKIVNGHQGDVDRLMEELKTFDGRTLNYLAMEVAREFVNFHSRKVIH